MFEHLKGYLVTFIVSKIMQVISGVLLALGLTAEGKYSIEEIIGAIVAFVIGWIISTFTHKKALRAIPPKE